MAQDSQDLQPLSQSQQLVSDLTKKLRHAFSEEATDQLVSQQEFNNVFNRIFTGIPSEKFRQIFISFDEENKGTINWYLFLKEEQLPKILLSLHDQSLSQITMLQQNTSSYSDTLNRTDDEKFENEDQDSIYIPTLNFTNTPHNTFATSVATSVESSPQVSKIEFMTSLEHEVQERNVEIQKLKRWITTNGLPAQQSISALKEKVTKATVREQTMSDEIKNMQEVTDSLTAQHQAVQQEHQQLETQHVALQNEHKYSKNLCSEMQRKYDQCLELYNKQKDQTTQLNLQITDLSKLKDQYEIVNSDQNNKIQQLKKERDDFREKGALLEMYCQDIAAENETLHHYIHTNISKTNALAEQSKESKQVSDSNAAKPVSKQLSAVNEDTESATTNFSKVDATAQSETPRDRAYGNHPCFNRSTSFNVHTFEQLTSKYSETSPSSGKRGSLLGRIRGGTGTNTPDVNSNISPADSVVIHNRYDSRAALNAPLNLHLSLFDQTSNTSNRSTSYGISPGMFAFGGRRHTKRKRRVSIISIGSYQHRSMQFGNCLENMGDSVLSGLADNDNDNDNDGYADQAYEELGDMEDMDENEMDDVDQLQELTEQLRMELQEELEEELEAQIEGKYELKILKLNNQHSEQLSKLKDEIQRLQAINRKQSNESRSNDANMAYNEDQKTNETGAQKMHEQHGGRAKLGDDMDDFRSDETFDDDLSDSESSYDDGNDDDDMHMDDDDALLKMERLDVSGGADSADNYVILNYDDDTSALLGSEDKSSKSNIIKSKKKKKKKDKKRGRKAEKNIKRGGFCCSSIFADFGKSGVDISSSESSGEKSFKSTSDKKKKKKKKKDKKSKKDKKKKKDKGKDKDKNKEKKKSKSKSKKKHKNRNKKYVDE